METYTLLVDRDCHMQTLARAVDILMVHDYDMREMTVDAVTGHMIILVSPTKQGSTPIGRIAEKIAAISSVGGVTLLCSTEVV